MSGNAFNFVRSPYVGNWRNWKRITVKKEHEQEFLPVFLLGGGPKKGRKKGMHSLGSGCLAQCMWRSKRWMTRRKLSWITVSYNNNFEEMKGPSTKDDYDDSISEQIVDNSSSTVKDWFPSDNRTPNKNCIIKYHQYDHQLFFWGGRIGMEQSFKGLRTIFVFLCSKKSPVDTLSHSCKKWTHEAWSCHEQLIRSTK
jgi:hypothetical protein